MIRLFALIGLLMLALTFQARAQSADPIAEYRAALSEAEDALNDEFALARARALLQTAFSDADIGFSQRYLDRWSATVFQRWARMRLVFWASDARLANWQAAVLAGEVSGAAAEAVLGEPVAQLLDLADRIPMWLSDDVTRLTERAFWTDVAQSVGCCDALYYHALDEADQVWAASQSPSAATIAGLELLPPVGMFDFDAAAQARAGLAMRAEALALEGGDTPGARRAMLNDAALVAELFSGGPAIDLADLAAREGFAAAPVAPLLALARITEPGPLRDTLIEQARMRLEMRVVYLRDGTGTAIAAVASDAMAPAVAPPSADPAPASADPAPAGTAGGYSLASGSGTSGGAPMRPAAPAAGMIAENAAATALATLQDESQSGLAAAAAAARAVDGLLVPGDISAVLTAR